MKKISILILVAMVSFSVQAQKISGKVEGHNKGEMDITIMAFGLDNLISAGKVDKKGNFSVNLNLATVSESLAQADNMLPLHFSFFFKCLDIRKFGLFEKTPAMREDYLRLVSNNQWAGTVFLVSDPALIPWLEDSSYKDAVKGTFYEVLYMTEDVILDFTCENEVFADENTNAEVTYIFDIELKKGFNWVQYDIEEVFETNPDIRAKFPSKVTIRNIQDPASMLWVGKYY
jgi:hypothetical protein